MILTGKRLFVGQLAHHILLHAYTLDQSTLNFGPAVHYLKPEISSKLTEKNILLLENKYASEPQHNLVAATGMVDKEILIVGDEHELHIPRAKEDAYCARISFCGDKLAAIYAAELQPNGRDLKNHHLTTYSLSTGQPLKTYFNLPNLSKSNMGLGGNQEQIFISYMSDQHGGTDLPRSAYAHCHTQLLTLQADTLEVTSTLQTPTEHFPSGDMRCVENMCLVPSFVGKSSHDNKRLSFQISQLGIFDVAQQAVQIYSTEQSEYAEYQGISSCLSGIYLAQVTGQVEGRGITIWNTLTSQPLYQFEAAAPIHKFKLDLEGPTPFLYAILTTGHIQLWTSFSQSAAQV